MNFNFNPSDVQSDQMYDVTFFQYIINIFNYYLFLMKDSMNITLSLVMGTEWMAIGCHISWWLQIWSVSGGNSPANKTAALICVLS